MTSNRPSPTILQIRDFINHVGQDPTHPGKGLVMQLHISLNIPDKAVYSDDVKLPLWSASLTRGTDLAYTHQTPLHMHGVLSSLTISMIRASIFFFANGVDKS
jgi:hypothetical protein